MTRFHRGDLTTPRVQGKAERLLSRSTGCILFSSQFLKSLRTPWSFPRHLVSDFGSLTRGEERRGRNPRTLLPTWRHMKWYTVGLPFDWGPLLPSPRHQLYLIDLPFEWGPLLLLRLPRLYTVESSSSWGSLLSFPSSRMDLILLTPNGDSSHQVTLTEEEPGRLTAAPANGRKGPWVVTDRGRFSTGISLSPDAAVQNGPDLLYRGPSLRLGRT